MRLLRVGDVGEQVALEHVRGREREPAVVHGLEDRVGVVVRVGGDLDEVDVLDQPVHEVRKRGALELLGEELLDVGVPGDDVRDATPTRSASGELLALVERLHAAGALGDVEVERPLAVLLREDQFGDLPLLLGVLDLVLQVDEEQRQRRQPLLAVDDELLAVLVADDDRAEEVVAVLGDRAALVALLVAVQELAPQVVEQLRDLLLLPLVLALVVVDRVLAAGEQLADGAPLAVDLA